MVEPPQDAYSVRFHRKTLPIKRPTSPSNLKRAFDEPDGKKMDGVPLIEELNKIAGANGIGRIDLVENRLVGIKSREVYEAPAAVTLHFAHLELERLTLDKEVFITSPNSRMTMQRSSITAFGFHR